VAESRVTGGLRRLLLWQVVQQRPTFQATPCFWLSLITLSSVALNALFGWWWADPIGALAMTTFILKEGREAWRGEDRCAKC